MDKLWTDEAWEDFLNLHSDKRLVKKLEAILKDIDRNGYKGIGKPEALKEDLSGYWSRRIDDYNRIVYKIVEENGKKHIEILQCGTHYHK
ncbi:MAG: Txe/YoeB family addiction module toxin [Treponema sp.]|jgi:toxin YoeB|nr:Txe/YoeB family addiction module toxin [Treponema sp.]MBQ2206096.1 Txe/YoeB family addiction module toxin [Treponema sp.]MBR3548530.1 Txe/YoeB family addiction module toxin [Treponema sp.]MBR6143609.1 Txe/YoeB family addiction module toxin [Treponema sp.]HAM77674.1 Txe/YoeB family addiction module toxin [Treponema sp.]